ncbi:hypothetical protein BV25DRAFT_385006 [Artomyces pyxidatus]|uniref:Uncharacterized protein n=1 Tax=Artomyces pyxidatus TaxID=48021 RepID=A0ACB8T401_9AGAM|nr:hypothetical protein BV25DRAFT_385006 [Artomyces pyxidatus]
MEAAQNVEKRLSDGASLSGGTEQGDVASSTKPTVQPATPDLPWFTEGYWSSDTATAMARKIYTKIMLIFTLLIIITVLTVLPIYWGALWQTTTHVHNLHGWVVDFDGGAIGQAISQAVLSTNGPSDTMTWSAVSPDQFPNGMSDVENDIVQQKSWAIITINPNATATLQAALARIDSSYVSNASVTAFAAEARSENAFKNVIHLNIEAILDQATAGFNAQYLDQLADSDQSLHALAKGAPVLLTQPVSYTVNNVRPFDVPVAAAVDFVGLIYLLILSFVVTMVNYAARVDVTHIEDRLTFPALMGMRILNPIIAYFVISLFYGLLSVAFQVPFNRTFGHSGFLVYWMMSWFAMAALGLAVESMITILTPRFVPFFLLLWIITNVSVCYFPPELLPGVYRYAYAMPFFNVQQAVRTIIFNTKNQLGLNFGVQLIWIAVSLCTITGFQYYKRYGKIRERQRLLSANMEKP